MSKKITFYCESYSDIARKSITSANSFNKSRFDISSTPATRKSPADAVHRAFYWLPFTSWRFYI